MHCASAATSVQRTSTPHAQRTRSHAASKLRLARDILHRPQTSQDTSITSIGSHGTAYWTWQVGKFRRSATQHAATDASLHVKDLLPTALSPTDAYWLSLGSRSTAFQQSASPAATHCNPRSGSRSTNCHCSCVTLRLGLVASARMPHQRVSLSPSRR